MAKKEDKPTKWKVISPRPYRWGRHKMMKPGQEFYAFEQDIPVDFLPMIMKVEEPVVESVKRTRTVKPAPVVEEAIAPDFWIKERIDGTFDIFSQTGKKMNEQDILSRGEAEEFVKSLKK